MVIITCVIALKRTNPEELSVPPRALKRVGSSKLLSASALSQMTLVRLSDLCPSGASGSLCLLSLMTLVPATPDSSPRSSSCPFVTNYTSLGFHLSENGAVVSPVEGGGAADARRRAHAALRLPCPCQICICDARFGQD